MFFFNDTATTEIYTLSLHDALPIYIERGKIFARHRCAHIDLLDAERIARAIELTRFPVPKDNDQDRKSTRLNSSHANISYAVFCLKKTTNRQYRSMRPHPSC